MSPVAVWSQTVVEHNRGNRLKDATAMQSAKHIDTEEETDIEEQSQKWDAGELIAEAQL